MKGLKVKGLKVRAYHKAKNKVLPVWKIIFTDSVQIWCVDPDSTNTSSFTLGEEGYEFLVDLDHLDNDEKDVKDFKPNVSTEENINSWFENDDFPQHNLVYFKGLELILMITKRALAVKIFKQDEEWYLKESVEYNGFSVVSTNIPGLHDNYIALRGIDKHYDNAIVQRSFANTDELKEYLLKMLQSLEFAEYKLEKEI